LTIGGAGKISQLRWWIVLALFAVYSDRLAGALSKRSGCWTSACTRRWRLSCSGARRIRRGADAVDYPIDIVPLFPPLSSVNMFVLPLCISLLFQYF
jgi:hypothetical protein